MTPACRSLCLSLSVLAACGGGAGSSGDRATVPLEPTVRDSAGVTIYEHPADALKRAPLVTIDSVPLAVFAGDVDDPSKDVSTISFLTFLASGNLIGYERQDHLLLELVVSDGRRVRLGRHGAGPGEIGSAGPLQVLPGDSLMFIDGNNNRVAIAQVDTGVVRTISRSEVEGFRGSSIGRVGDSLYLLTIPAPFAGLRKAGPSNDPILLGTWRVGDDSVRQRLSVPSGWLVWAVMTGTDPQGRKFSGATGYGLALAPRTGVAQWGSGFLVARGERWELEHWDTAGRLTRLVRVNTPARPVDDALFERSVESDAAEMAGFMRNAGRDPDVDSIRASIRDRGHADNLAAYGRVHVAPGGTIWVADYPLPGDSTWAATAIAPDGRILGRITAQVGDPPIAWGDDRVAFKTEDDLGIATITVKRLGMPR